MFEERYEQGDVIGKGGMGAILLCRDRELDRQVAVKVSQASDPIGLDRFLREARIQGQLEHPAIVPVYDCGRMPDGQPYFAMKRILGTSLREILGRLMVSDPRVLKKYTRTKLLGAFASMCLAIDFAHSKNVIHRDLKPGNIMLGEFGEVYILDWGIAKRVGESEPRGIAQRPDELGQTTEGSVFGTPGYMAPEQATGDPNAITFRTDVYALGLILFEILTLEPVHASTTSLHSHVLAIPPELVAICERAMASDPNDRWASARDMADALDRFLEGDRDQEVRHKAAEEHLHLAKRALVRALDPATNEHEERALGLREASRAMALEPTNKDATTTVLHILLEPPRSLPAEAAAEIEEERIGSRRVAGRYGVLGTGIAAVLLSFLLVMGVENWRLFGLAYVMAGLAAAAGVFAVRGRPSGTTSFVIVICWTALLLILTRLFGPLVMVPIMSLGLLVPIVLNATERMHFAIAIGSSVSSVMLLLELVGVVSKSYLFAAGMMCIQPGIARFPEGPTLALLLGSQLLTIALTLLMVVRVRDRTISAEKRLRLHAWYLKRLVK